MQAKVNVIITIEVTNEKQAIQHVARFMQMLCGYAEIEKVELEKIEIVEEDTQSKLPF